MRYYYLFKGFVKITRFIKAENKLCTDKRINTLKFTYDSCELLNFRDLRRSVDTCDRVLFRFNLQIYSEHVKYLASREPKFHLIQ